MSERNKQSLTAAVSEVDTEAGRQRVADYPKRQPYPRYEDVAGSPNILRQNEADGTVTIGHFVNRVFVPDA